MNFSSLKKWDFFSGTQFQKVHMATVHLLLHCLRLYFVIDVVVVVIYLFAVIFFISSGIVYNQKVIIQFRTKVFEQKSWLFFYTKNHIFPRKRKKLKQHLMSEALFLSTQDNLPRYEMKTLHRQHIISKQLGFK